MTSEKNKRLWGQDFRIVGEGLAETDVVIFVEKLMRQHHESLKQLDHIASLHELATKTVQDAEALAAGILEEAGSEAQTQAETIAEEATRKSETARRRAGRAAAEASRAAREEVDAMVRDAHSELRERIARIDSSLKKLEEAALHELSSRMNSHYIWKYLHQSVHFLPAFKVFIREVESQLDEKESQPPPAASPSPSTDVETPQESALPGES